MPKEFEYLRHRLKLEELKLLDWWLSRSGSAAEDIGLVGHQAHERQQAVVACLEQIKNLTLEVKEINDRYGLSLQSSDNESEFGDESGPSVSLIQVHISILSCYEQNVLIFRAP